MVPALTEAALAGQFDQPADISMAAKCLKKLPCSQNPQMAIQIINICTFAIAPETRMQ